MHKEIRFINYIGIHSYSLLKQIFQIYLMKKGKNATETKMFFVKCHT